MTSNAQRLDDWIRGNFVELNTALEELYFASDTPEVVEGIGDSVDTAVASTIKGTTLAGLLDQSTQA